MLNYGTMSSQNRFGYEGDRYAVMTEEYEGQFRNWTTPFRPKIGGKEVPRLKVYRFSLFSPAQALSPPRKIVMQRSRRDLLPCFWTNHCWKIPVYGRIPKIRPVQLRISGL